MKTPFHLCFFLLMASALIPTGHAEEIKKVASKVAFAKADAALNSTWTAVKAALPEGEFNKLKEEQRGWLEYRDYLARSPLYAGTGTQEELALDSAEYLDTAASLTAVRQQWLEALVKPQDESGLTGLWIDSYGGEIEIVESKGSLAFAITCARGPTSHTGDLGGVATWNAPIGWFSDKGDAKEDADEASLAFILRGSSLEIIGANTAAYHGARAYFDGMYVKVKPLSAKRQKELAGKARE